MTAPETPIKVSVAMCTFNGALHIREQLDSLVRQSVRPDELILVDDQSTDDTVRLVREFCDSVTMCVHVVVNESRLGVVANFQKALMIATGDVIFLSDQDDVWEPEKIAITLVPFKNPSVQVVACDAALVNSKLEPLGASLWTSQGFTFRHYDQVFSSQSFETLIERNLVAGMTMAVRRSYLTKVLPVPFPWMHDGWICLVAASQDALRLIPQELVKYRQHGKNTIGAQVWSLRQKVMLAWDFSFELEETRVRQLEAALTFFDGVTPLWRLADLKDRIAHMKARCLLPKVTRLQRIPIVVREVWNWRYSRFSGGAAAAVLDAIRPNRRSSSRRG